MVPTFHRLLPSGHPTAGMTPSDFTEPATFTTDDRTELNHTFFRNADESVLVGVWTCAPCREQIDDYPVHEMMVVLSGAVTLPAPDGRAETFVAGDTFFVARGTRCTWHITETLTKYYMIVERA